jgi:hypothetical protein
VGPAPQPPEHVSPGALVDDRQPSGAGVQRLRARKVASGTRAKGSRVSGGSICWLRLESETVHADLDKYVDPVELCFFGIPGGIIIQCKSMCLETGFDSWPGSCRGDVSKVGSFCWLALANVILETLICIKFGQGKAIGLCTRFFDLLVSFFVRSTFLSWSFE